MPSRRGQCRRGRGLQGIHFSFPCIKERVKAFARPRDPPRSKWTEAVDRDAGGVDSVGKYVRDAGIMRRGCGRDGEEGPGASGEDAHEGETAG